MFFGFFIFINSSPRLTFYRHIVAVKATIDKLESARKIVVLEHIQRGRNFVWQKISSCGGNNFCDPKTND